MLTHKEFHERARALANGLYFSTAVEASESSSGALEIDYGLYVHGHGWHKARTPELAIESFTNTPPPASPEALAALDPVPEASAPVAAPEQDIAF